MSRGWLDKLEKLIVQSINGLKDEIINLKDIVINNLQDERKMLGWKKNVKNLNTEFPYLNQIKMIWFIMAHIIM